MDMTEEFKNREGFLHWFLIASVAGLKTKSKEMCKEPRMVTMQLNGVEIDPLRAINRLEEEFERRIEERAKEMVEDITNDILTPFNDQVEDLTSAVRNMLSTKLPNHLKETTNV